VKLAYYYAHRDEIAAQRRGYRAANRLAIKLSDCLDMPPHSADAALDLAGPAHRRHRPSLSPARCAPTKSTSAGPVAAT
jgi:hypothetical protein